MNRLPDQSNSPSGNIYEAAEVKDIEDALDVYVFSLYRMDARDCRNYRQRSILVTLKPRPSIENTLKKYAEKINEWTDVDNKFQTELMSDEEFIDLDHRRPQDSTVIALEAPLVIAKRSPTTGQIFHDLDYEYCPKTSVPLRHVIHAAPNGNKGAINPNNQTS